MALILNRYTLDYRSEVVDTILATTQHGYSMCLVGLAGSGKSNLVTFITQPEVLARLPLSLAQKTHIVAVNCAPGMQPPAQLYRAMLHELEPIAAKVQYTLPAISDETVYYELRKTVKQLCTSGEQRIVFVLDEFEQMIKHQPLELFEELRNVRDEVRTTDNFAYVAITHRMPQCVVGNQRFANSKLYELLCDHVYAFCPYRPADAVAMFNTLAAKEGVTIASLDRERILGCAGGHSGILRAILLALKPHFGVTAKRIVQLAEEDGPVRTACEHIWKHLHSSERTALLALLAGETPPLWMCEFLYKRGLTSEVNAPRIFSPVFEHYIAGK